MEAFLVVEPVIPAKACPVPRYGAGIQGRRGQRVQAGRGTYTA